jgi:ketosteroid isomerase-like protein
MTPIEIVLAFMDRINQRDPDQLSELMTEDHVLVDSLGRRMQGRATMRKSWGSYYAFCPDYWVSHEDVFVNGNIVAVFGAAGGTIRVNGKLPAANKWQIPAAWRAVVENGLVKEWRVFADNKPVYDIMAISAAPI